MATKKSKARTKKVAKSEKKRVVKKRAAEKKKPINKSRAVSIKKKATVKNSQKLSGKKNSTSKSKPPRKPKSKFKSGDHVVYPTHGVGLVQGIENEKIGGTTLDLVVVKFVNDRMTLRVPTNKMDGSGLRAISSKDKMDKAIETLKGRARVKRTMWSRRAQEYEAKINSGNPDSIAQVVRDLFRNVGQPDQSFSERQIYEVALDRLAGEVAAIDETDVEAAIEKLERTLRASE